MAKAIETLSIKLEFKDAGTQQIISKLSSSLKGMTSVVKGNTSPAISKLRNEILNVGKASTQSISNFRNQANALRALRDEARVGSATFKRLTEDIKKLDAQMAKAQSGGRRGISARATTQIAGAVVSGGIFGGPEGALGALGGAALGGVQGAFAGAAIGGQIGGIRQAGAAAAEYAANISKLRIALQGVTTSQREYFQGLEFVQQTTKDFAIPQEVVTRQFTKLQASVQGAGGNIDDTKIAFNGIVAAVRATGGSLADVDSALTATAQVFSKGKVSAEELRQQIGERLPGAFTLFAQSMGLTPQELDKALEKGQVSLEDFQGFAKAIFERYGENAKAIAAGPQSAGDRLKVQLEKLSESVGTLLRPIGAFFQETFGAIVRDITRATNALARFLNLSFDEAKLAAAQERFDAAQATLDNPAATVKQRQRALQSREQARKTIATQTRLRDAGIDVQQPGAGSGLAGVDDGTGAGTGTKSTLARRVEQAQALENRMQRQLLLAQQQTQLGRLLAKQDNERSVLQEKIAKLKQGETSAELERATASAKNLLNQKLAVELQQKVKDLAEKATKPLEDALKAIKEKVAFDKRYSELIKKGINPERAKEIIKLEKLKKLALEELDILIDSLRVRAAKRDATQEEIDLLDELLKKRKEVEGKDPEKDTEPLKKQESDFGKFKDTFKEGLEEMMDIGPKLAGVALNAIGSMTDGLIELITTGKANFAEMAAAILKDISKIMIQAAIAGAIKQMFFAADGAVLQGGRVKKYANGGVVGGPTFFPMAGGQVGLMGEAGPEAIMPLKRGSDGKLGVTLNDSDMGASMSRYSPGGRSASGISGGDAGGGDYGGSMGGGTVVNYNGPTLNFNSEDYVPASAVPGIIDEAAKRGAKAGETRTFASLQNSRSRRSRIGLGS